MIASTLFTWLQGADFYHDLHREAVEALPLGNGKTWLDVGTGPGLVARMAARRGYRASGIDADSQMIQAAQRIARREHSSAKFQTGDLASLPTESANIVSAASLLAVLPDRSNRLKLLWKAVKLGGQLLVVEPTDQMTSDRVDRLIRDGLPGKRTVGLRMWARARQGNIVDPKIYEELDADLISQIPLLHGLVAAWIFQKKAVRE